MNDLKQKRIISIIIDTFIIGLLSSCLGLCLVLFKISMASQISVMLFYCLFGCKDCYNGMSIGKYILKIQVIDNKTLKAASPFKCFLRNYLLFAWIIEAFMMLYSNQGRRIGDYITNTKVVPFKQQQRQVNLKSIIIVIGTVSILSILLLLIIKYQIYNL